mgnify:CR=1 FL=1
MLRSIAGQFLALQLVVIAAVLVAVGAVSVAQSTKEFRDVRGQRMIAVAEQIAATPIVRDRYADPLASAVLAPEVDRAVDLSGASLAEIIDPAGVVLASSNPLRVRTDAELGDSDARTGRAWFGDVDIAGRRSLVGHVPVLSSNGDVLALVSVSEDYPSTWQLLSGAGERLVLYLALGAVLGAIGSALQGRGAKLGDLLARSDAYLADINPSLPALRRDMIAAAGATELYSQVMPDLLRTASNAIVTSGTIHAEQRNLDTVLLNVAGLANTGGNVLRENETNLVTALDLLRPTTELLDEYKAALSCLINGLGQALPAGEAIFGGLQEGVALNASFMTGAPAYTYPRDLPKVNATGGPHCMGMPDKPKESHAPYLVTDTATVPYVPNLRVVVDPPKVFQVLFAGLLPGGGAR